MKDFFVQIPLE